ncbi:hypothetical protein Bca4012_068831 [Brassica carinata]
MDGPDSKLTFLPNEVCVMIRYGRNRHHQKRIDVLNVDDMHASIYIIVASLSSIHHHHASDRNKKVVYGYSGDDTNITIGTAEILSPHDAYHSSNRPTLKPKERKDVDEMEKGRRIGSKPPTCEKKCYGCEPCEAIQVPTISSSPHLSPHNANYKPEGWRCHCTP